MLSESRNSDQILVEIDAARRNLAYLSSAEEQAGEDLLARLVVEAQTAGVYPQETVKKNPNTVLTMVKGWGARWFEWTGMLTCPKCGSDWRDYESGPPFKREIGNVERDRIASFKCPDCGEIIR